MKSLFSFVLMLMAGATAAKAGPVPFFEAGASYFVFSGARYTNGPGVVQITPTSASSSQIAGTPADTRTTPAVITSQDKSELTPFVAVGLSLTDQLGLRLSYRYLSALDAHGSYAYNVGGDTMALAPFAEFSDHAHLLSLAPVLKFKVGDNFSVEASPELNWISDRAEVRAASSNLVLDRQTQNGFTAGGTIGLLWDGSKRWALATRYSYFDLHPIRHRTAQVFSESIIWHW